MQQHRNVRLHSANFVHVMLLFLRCWNTLTRWNGVQLKKLTVSLLVKKFPVFLWKIHYRVHKSSPLIVNLSHMNPFHFVMPCLSPILILYFHLRLGLPSGLFPAGFPTKILYAFLFI